MKKIIKNRRQLLYWTAFFIVFVIYLISLAPAITEEDSGDFVMAGWYFGASHPTGYPLFILFERLAAQLPFADPAFRMNLLSAFFGALAAPLLMRLLVLCGFSVLAAFSGALVMSFSRTLWLQSVITEVYSMNICLIYLLAIFAQKWINAVERAPLEYFRKNRLYLGNAFTSKAGPDSYLLFSWFILGLGMSCHHSIGLAGLGIALYAFIRLEKKIISALMPKRLISGIFLFFIGLMPYFIFIIRTRTADPLWNWGEPSSIYQLKRMIFRTQYDDTLIVEWSWTLFKEQIKFWLQTFYSQWSLPVFVMGVLGTIFWARTRLSLLIKNIRSARSFPGLIQRRIDMPSHGFDLFFILFILFSIVLILINPFTMEEIYTYSSSVFFIPAYIILAAGIAFILDSILNTLNKSRGYVSSKAGYKVILCTALLLVFPIFQLFHNFRACDASDNSVAWDFNRNILKSMDRKSVAFIAGDAISFPLSYLVNLRRVSPQTTVISLPSLSYFWYLPQIQRRVPELIDFQVRKFVLGSDVILPRLKKIADSAERLGRKIYFSQIKTELLKNNEMIPTGLMYRKVARGDGPSAQEFHKAQIDEFKKMQIRFPAYFYEKKSFKRNHLVAHGLISNYAYMFYNTGIYLAEKNAYKMAIYWFERALKIREDHSDTLYNLGFCHARLKKFEKAEKYYLEHLKIEPDSVSAISNLARIWLFQKKYKKSANILLKAIKRNPESAEAYLNMGVLYYKMERVAEARKYWTEALKRDPELNEASQFLQKTR